MTNLSERSLYEQIGDAFWQRVDVGDPSDCWLWRLCYLENQRRYLIRLYQGF